VSEPPCRGQPRDAAADDHHVAFGHPSMIR
jgi:hypothetical protein